MLVAAAFAGILLLLFVPTMRELRRAVVREEALRRDVFDAGVREHRRIGRDLHDGLGQHLTGVSFMLHGLAERLRAAGRPEVHQAAEVQRLVAAAISQVRDLATALNPVGANDFATALHALAAYATAAFGVECRVRAAAGFDVDAVTAEQLYRIAQEAVTNAIRHGGARHVEIVLQGSGAAGKLTVVDDGVGFAESDVAPGMGLRGMRQRAALVRGTVSFASTTGHGTRLVSSFAGHASVR